MRVAAGVADHAHRTHRQIDGERLAYLVVPVRAPQLFQKDGVGLAQHGQVFAPHLAEHAHRETRAGKGMASDQRLGQAERQAQLAHFVLEQIAQRFQQAQVHALRQAAHVVVGLDDPRLAGGAGGGFDHVWVDRALGEPARAVDLRGFALENVHERGADGLAFGFGLGHAGKYRQKALAGIDHAQLHGQRVGRPECRTYLIGLIFAQQAVVHEDAGQLFADGARDQRRHDARIDAPREAEQHAVVAHLLADAGDGAVDDVGDRPVAGAAGDVAHEPAQQLAAALGVHDFRVELHAEEAPLRVRHGGDRRIGAGRGDLEARRQRGHLVAVAHPHVEGASQPLEQRAVAPHLQFRVAELAVRRTFHGAAELHGHRLHPVADAEHRRAAREHRVVDARRGGGGDRLRAAGENNAARREGTERVLVDVEGADLAVDAVFAHPAGDELGGLGTEVQHQNAVAPSVGRGLAVARGGQAGMGAQAPG